MSRKRKKPSSRPSGAPGGAGKPVPLEPELLDVSTTETSFLYFGREGDAPPSETMRMVGEVASQRDREWFEANPGADYRVRWSLPGEFPTEGVEMLRGNLDVESGRFVVVVLQMKPGARRRIPTLFRDGEKTSEPIPVELWPEFHRVATSEDVGAASRALVRRFMS